MSLPTTRIVPLTLPKSLAVLFSLALLTGCPAKGGGPVGALGEYSRALERGDYDSAYSMMSDGYRARHSKRDFVRMLKDNPKDVKDTAGRLRRRPGDVEVTAVLRYGLGDRMELVQEGGTWRIASNPVDFYGQSTPREALRSFLRAYQLQRWDIMLKFVPNVYRDKMNADMLKKQFAGEQREEIDRMMNMIAANVDEPIADKGNEARMRYGERYEVKFVREDSVWKIEDLD